MEQKNQKINEALQLLAQVWYLWRKEFPGSKNTGEVLKLIQRLQLIVFEEDSEDTPG